jgi:RNA 3'-terminal phosphate cyclase (ATP)
LERTDIVTIDGSHGEGGGQILRTALSLSAITSRPFRIVSVRATRRKPGLQPQHLSATRAAAAITGATVVGDLLGSSELTFTPSHKPQAGSYLFDVAEFAGHGSAGFSSLILQTHFGSVGVGARPLERCGTGWHPSGMGSHLRPSRQ